MARRTIRFEPPERQRIAACCQVLGITFEEFVEMATMNAVGELEYYARAVREERPEGWVERMVVSRQGYSWIRRDDAEQA